jgi:hypothetical protein
LDRFMFLLQKKLTRCSIDLCSSSVSLSLIQ